MCLRINTKRHKRNLFGKYKPLTAEKDIEVGKLICRGISSSGDIKYRTSYMFTPVEFKDGVAVLTAEKFGYHRDSQEFRYPDGKKRPEIDKGIHSYIGTTIVAPSWFLFCRAIIPKGTKYYIGLDGDVVSLELVIFEPER